MAHVPLHPSWQLAGCHDRYTPRSISVASIPSGERVRGVFRDDGPLPPGQPRLPDRTFDFLLPLDCHYPFLCSEIHRRLRNAEPLTVSFF